MTRHPVLAATVCALALSPAYAQIRQGQVRPAWDVKVLQTPLRRQEVVELKTIPADMVEFQKVQGWAIKRAPRYPGGGIPPAVVGAYAELTRTALPGKRCQDQLYQATINLAQVRANGFRLTEYSFEPVPPPAGFVAEGPYPNRGAATGPSLATFKSIWVARPILAMILSPNRSFPRPCWSAFHVRIKLRGPAGINPLTGRPIAPRAEVH